MILKRFLAFFLSLSLIISSTSALAASPAGWTVSVADTVMAGATATITAFKGSGSNAVKAVIAHKPTAVMVGKELIKGGGVIALAYAMSKLLDAGVDWVLDPENNAVSYDDPSVGGSAGAGVTYSVQGSGVKTTAADACTAYAANNNQAWGANTNFHINFVSVRDFTPANFSGGVSGYSFFCDFSKVSGGVTSVQGSQFGLDASTSAPTKKYIPISTVAGEVIAGAEAGHAESQDFVKAVAVGQANAGDLDTALDAAAEPTTDTADPDAPPADPAKPFDDSGILAALKKILTALGLLSILGTISDTLSSMSDWFKAEPESESTELDIDVPDVAAPNTDINFGGQCPAPYVFNGSIFGNAISIQLLDTAMFCDFLATYVKWPIYAASTLFALYIYGGRKDE